MGTITQQQVDDMQTAMGCVLKGTTPTSKGPSHCKTHHRMFWHENGVKGCKTAYEAVKKV
jgi:hypothetical protein